MSEVRLEFLVDENLESAAFLNSLSTLGLTFFTVRDLLGAGTKDADIFSLARLRNLVVITEDKDFNTLIRIETADPPSVIWLRTKDQQAITSGINKVIQNRSGIVGNFLAIVKSNDVRIKLLPLSR